MKVNWVSFDRNRNVGGDGLGRHADLGQPGRAALRRCDLRRTGSSDLDIAVVYYADNDNCVVKAEL
jgi:hypothetical protein